MDLKPWKAIDDITQIISIYTDRVVADIDYFFHADS